MKEQPKNPMTAHWSLSKAFSRSGERFSTESVSDVQSTRHRQEVVGVVNDVEFINDSKAVSVDLTWYSLERLEGELIWIVGGLQEGQDYTMLKELVQDKVRGIVCLGRESSKVYKTFHGLYEM
jgi:UDP-N-acetylmuramoylalanine--D-glutamate ligase